jgi:hypothetical protein
VTIALRVLFIQKLSCQSQSTGWRKMYAIAIASR